MKLTGDFSLTNQWIIIGAKGKIEVPAGRTFFYTGLNAAGERTVAADGTCADANSPIRICDGGEVRVLAVNTTLEPVKTVIRLADGKSLDFDLTLLAHSIRTAK